MASLGLDYSTARPGGAALKAAGVVAVGRYLGSDSRCITAAEYADLVAHGIGTWFVKESQTADLSVSMLNGYNKGVADALAAEAAIKSVGLPAGAPVYWAADFDIAPGSTRVAQAEAYVDGWNTIIPAGRRGGYGGLWFLNYIRSKAKIDLLWECASTSFRHGVNPAAVPINIQQTTLTPPIAGTDHNYIFDTTSLASSGATLIGGFLMALSDDQQTQVANDIATIKAFLITGVGTSVERGKVGVDFGAKSVMGRLDNLANAIISQGGTSMPDGGRALGKSVADLRGLLEALGSGSAAIDYQALAKEVAPLLAPLIAAALPSSIELSGKLS